DDALQVGYYSGEDYAEWHPMGETYAWNYHKGSRLQWCGGDNRVIYNTCEGDTLKAVVCDVNSDDTRQVSWPIDHVSIQQVICNFDIFSYPADMQAISNYWR
ncbi:MAG: hypothetical protein II661_02835, partial [Bacteroidales bacterium]|nr:hypothetical protein [Bacteroidales bacterium]